MVAGVFAELARERPRRRFTIGITDDVSRHEPALRPDAGHRAARAPCARCSSASARTGPSARTRTRSRSSAPRRACTRRATSSTTRRSRARRPSRTCASGRGRSGRPTWCGRPSFVGCHQFGLLERVDVLGRAAPGATLLLNCRAATGSGLGRAAPPGAGADPGQADRAVRDRRRPDRPRRRAWPGGPTPCCRPASSPSPACCPASEAIERDQGGDRQDLRPARRRGGRAQPGRGGPGAGGAAPGRGARAGDGYAASCPPIVPAHAPEFVRTVTAAMMAGRGDELPVSALPVDGTYPSGTTAYEKRNISELVAVWDPDLCIQCGNCSFVCPHSVIRSKLLRTSPSWTAPRTGFRSAPLERPRPARHPLHAAGVRRGLHRLRAVRRGVPGRRHRADPARKAINLAPREPLVAAERENIAFFETLPANDRSRVDFGTVRGTQFLRAAVRVLRRLRRVRRDAVPEAALAAVRRPADDRQRDRLLVDLRRQPAHHAVDGRRRRARPGLVELAVRGQRRVRARLPAGRRPAHRAGPPPADRAARRGRRRAGGRDPRRAAAARVGAARAARAGRRAEAAARRAGRRRPCARPAQRGRPPGPAQRLDRRRRRLGLRHRLRRARPRAGQRAQRQRARARHRGLLQHRRPDVQGDAARRGREVRRRRQDRAEEGPRAAGDRLRQRLRRPGRDGRRSAADAERLPRGRGLRRAVAGASPTATASRTASTCATGSTSSTAPSPAATGR